MKNKGFTLIELLAILVILAVIALIGTPIISNVIKNAKASALVESARNILDAAQLDYDEAKLNETDHTSASNLKYKGTQYDDLYINYLGNLQIAIYDNGTCAYGTKTNMITTDAASATECYNKIKGYVTVNTVSEALAYDGSSYLIYEGMDSITNDSATPTTTPQTGDTLICGQYEYTYNVYYTDRGWVTDNTMNGWAMRVTSSSQMDKVYNTRMLTKINGKYVNCFSCLFGNSAVTNIDLSSFETSQVTNMSFAFARCFTVNLDVSYLDTSKVTNMSGMFYACEPLVSLDLSNFDTTKVTNMGQMFESCRGLTSVNLISFDTSKVTDMHDMFWGCDSLINLAIDHFDISAQPNVKFMFCEVPTATYSAYITSWNATNVNNYEYLDVCNIHS